MTIAESCVHVHVDPNSFCSHSFTSNSSRELHVLWHDGNSLCMDSTKICIFKETNKVCLRSLLEGKDSWCLESQVIFVFWRNFSNEPLEWKFPDEQFGALLKLSDFSQSNGAWFESVWLFDTTWSLWILSLFVSYMFSWGFATSVLPCSLLCSCHLYF